MSFRTFRLLIVLPNFVGGYLFLSMKIIVTLWQFLFCGSTANPDFLREPLIPSFSSFLCPAGHTLEPLYFSLASVPQPRFRSSIRSLQHPATSKAEVTLIQSIFLPFSSTCQSQDDLYSVSLVILPPA